MMVRMYSWSLRVWMIMVTVCLAILLLSVYLDWTSASQELLPFIRKQQLTDARLVADRVSQRIAEISRVAEEVAKLPFGARTLDGEAQTIEAERILKIVPEALSVRISSTRNDIAVSVSRLTESRREKMSALSSAATKSGELSRPLIPIVRELKRTPAAYSGIESAKLIVRALDFTSEVEIDIDLRFVQRALDDAENALDIATFVVDEDGKAILRSRSSARLTPQLAEWYANRTIVDTQDKFPVVQSISSTGINFAVFESNARAAGFDEALVRDWAPNTVVETHAHPFDADALVTQGEMWLTCGTTTRHLRPGDTFSLASGDLHAERYGPQGATYWVARRKISLNSP